MSTTSASSGVSVSASNQGAARLGRWLQIWHARDFAIRTYTATIADLHPDLDGFQIAHLSDLHLRTYWSYAYEQLAEILRQLQVDLILCTGDIVDNKNSHHSALPHMERLFPLLQSRLGTWTILGNHDNFRMIKDLERLGVHVLNGDRTLLRDGGASLELIGTPGLYRVDLPESFGKAYPSPAKGTPRVLLCHYPDQFNRLRFLEPDLYLAGHTHAGQVCLPGGGMLVRHDSSPKHLCRGAHRLGKTHYLVNHGFGFSGVPVRLFCPAEFVLITLKRQ